MHSGRSTPGCERLASEIEPVLLLQSAWNWRVDIRKGDREALVYPDSDCPAAWGGPARLSFRHLSGSLYLATDAEYFPTNWLVYIGPKTVTVHRTVDSGRPGRKRRPGIELRGKHIEALAKEWDAERATTR